MANDGQVERVHMGTVIKWRDLHPGGDTTLLRTSYPCATEADRAKVIELIESQDVPGESMIGQELSISDYIVHPVQITDEATGEVADAIRCILPQPDGRLVAFVSTSILEGINRLAFVRQSLPPWEPAIRVRLIQVRTGRKRLIYKLLPVTS